MTKLVVLYKTPKDETHFAKHYRDVHVPLAKDLPGIKGHSFGPARGPDGGAGAYFWYFSATFDSAKAIADALGSPHGQKVVADIPNYYHEQPVILVVENTDR